MKSKTILLLAGAIFCCAFFIARARAQSSPPTTPATAPARVEFSIPPGFHRLEAAGRTAVCESADDAWVKQALTTITPATRPSTNPSDIVQLLGTRRELLKAHIAGDLSMKDLAPVDELIDKTLIPKVARIAGLHAPVFYLVTTSPRLKELVKGGWNDPRFYYNRAADDVQFTPRMPLSDEHPMDDLVMPVIYAPDSDAARRRELLQNIARQNEVSMEEAFSRRAMIVMQLAFVDFIQNQVFTPMKLKDDQAWLSLGIEAVLSARYMQDVIGLSGDQLLDQMTREVARNPVRASSIDLLHPANLKEMRPQWVPAYLDAYRIRSAKVVYEWVKKSGDSSISMTLAAMRGTPPADGAALVKLIAVTTGIDLTNEMKPR